LKELAIIYDLGAKTRKRVETKTLCAVKKVMSENVLVGMF
jgi:hypothetical protein